MKHVDVMEKSLSASKQRDCLEKNSTPRDCYEVYQSGERVDGVYTVYVGREQRPVDVYCDMTTDGRGWTVCRPVMINERLLNTTNSHH